MKTITHDVDFCVVGGGLAGLCAAVSAARNGIKTAIMQERPVFGGNASSEVRMHVCGAHGDHNRETGIVEEIRLANLYRNARGSWSIWDSVMFEIARFTPNLELFLNCSCTDATMDGNRIVSVKGWQMTTQTWQEIRAKQFADCSGDSILAPLTGAEVRWGREARSEFNEDIEPENADRKTMGLSCLLEARETDRPQKFIPPEWAKKYPTDESMHNRHHDLPIGGKFGTNFWWIEIGGEGDSILDSEKNRDELLAIAFGVWDHIKNHGDHGTENWILDWVGFLPGKRESRRYVGDYIMTQNDVRAEGKFNDTIAYGGWSMDDHHPAGMNYPGAPTIFHPAPSPYGIAYRTLYSRNIENLFCAGRNISVTHAAMSSTRVMATCGILGQAVGTAAALAVKNNLSPRSVYEQKLEELQQTLMDDDCFLPGFVRAVPEISKHATLTVTAGDAEILRDGHDRNRPDENHLWTAPSGSVIEYTLDTPVAATEARLVLDSNLITDRPCMPSNYPLDAAEYKLPETLLKSFKLEIVRENGTVETVRDETCNRHRLVKAPLTGKVKALRLTTGSNWGDTNEARIFSFDFH